MPRLATRKRLFLGLSLWLGKVGTLEKRGVFDLPTVHDKCVLLIRGPAAHFPILLAHALSPLAYSPVLPRPLLQH